MTKKEFINRLIILAKKTRNCYDNSVHHEDKHDDDFYAGYLIAIDTVLNLTLQLDEE